MDSIERMTKLSLVLWFVRSYEIFPMRQMVGQTMQRWSQKGVRRAVTLWSPRTQRKKMPMRKSTRRGEKPPGKKEKCRQELRWQGSKQCLFSNQYLLMWFLLLEFFLTFSQTFLCFDRYWPRCIIRIHNLMESSTFYNDKLLRDLSRPIKFQLITVHLNNGSWFHETTKS